MNDEDILNYFRESGALLEGHFILSSGYHSSMYLQCAKIFMNPNLSEILCKNLAGKISKFVNISDIDMIVSPAMGGVIIGYEVARHLNKRSIFTERVDGVFEFRRGFQIENGMNILIIEDVITTGKSSLECIDCVKNNGGNILGVSCMIDRTQNTVIPDLDIISLSKISIPIYKPNDVPENLNKIPPIKPGSRGLI